MKDKRKAKPSESYLKYSGMAFQMFFVLLFGWFMGNYVDRYFALEKPYVGVGLSFLLLIGYFFKIYYDLQRGKL